MCLIWIANRMSFAVFHSSIAFNRFEEEEEAEGRGKQERNKERERERVCVCVCYTERQIV